MIRPPAKNSLVLYKHQPARVVESADKLTIEIANGVRKSVRIKDVTPLHEGPIQSLTELTPRTGEVAVAWELLAGGATRLSELAELIYEEDSAPAVWAAWQLVREDLYFHGDPDRVVARTGEEVAALKRAREEKAREKAEWSAFLRRVRSGGLNPEDAPRLQSVEALALGRAQNSRVLSDLGLSGTREQAHALLLRLSVWDATLNPYPPRLDLPDQPPDLPLPDMPEEERLDLTHLPAFAVDDEGSEDPDDAISIDGGRIWVHVADVAALVAPDSELDLEARARGANSYLPERTNPMLPHALTDRLALGLQAESPALSIGFVLDETCQPRDVQIAPSRVRVTRLTYAEATERLGEEPLASLARHAERYRQRRRAQNAVRIDLPEAKIRVVDGEVCIRPLPRLASREMVTDIMLMAGEGIARFALEREIVIPFATQQAPETIEDPRDPAAMFAYRKKLKRSQMKTVAEPHAGLGLPVYTRATSPLRRYVDLIVHQQIRAHMRGEPTLDGRAVVARLGAAEAVSGSVIQAERLSNRHWTLVYLLRHPQWRGTGILVDKRGRQGTILIPELALEAGIHLAEDWPLNQELDLSLKKVDLPNLAAQFQVSPAGAGGQSPA